MCYACTLDHILRARRVSKGQACPLALMSSQLLSRLVIILSALLVGVNTFALLCSSSFSFARAAKSHRDSEVGTPPR